ncbi:PREDICTED: uncharacterized protein LOC107102207 [Cyprinodon variegatus]|uniref:uncharacterized protein LOC107102207 n=1 Tax=Cyprinodon variegatus TaxID=28743 RepID=UPI000742A8CB|nr:PREDICTED: uncharacterized protein LOC107102207 [Cyprinodon variegatus]
MLPYASKPTVIQQPSGSDVYIGEKVTLRCEIYGDGGTKWTYEWRPTNRNSPTSSEYRINRVSTSDSGEYSCRAEGDHQMTEWSDALPLKVRMTGRTNWTEQNSYLINGQNHTAGYVCRAGRGEPVFYTEYSEAKFVWSADSHPAASLSVTPDRVQHFINQSVTLSCSRNNTEWKLRRFKKIGWLSYTVCSNWGTMTGSSCSINTDWSHSGVYWCESGSGDFSNAVNITVQNKYYSGIILVSPAHPVTEGDPVTLSCGDKEQKLLSNVFFYHNNKLIHNDSREELKISAVSKSDEGFYKCKHSRKESPQSWMAVRVAGSSVVSSSFSPLLIAGPLVGILLIVLLLLLWRYRWFKEAASSKDPVQVIVISTSQ